MARSLRIQYNGARYHVINRGNYRKNLFTTHRTAEAFTNTLFETCERYDWWLHAYVIMKNHFHLCLETPKANLVDGMHWLLSSFSNRFSKFSGERGHVFQGRYKSLIIEGDSNLLKVVDYVHLNPVRANLLPAGQLNNYYDSSFPKFFSKNRHPRLRCEVFLAQAGGLKADPAGFRNYHKHLMMLMEQPTEKRKRLFDGLSQGWHIGSRDGARLLLEQIKSGDAVASSDALAALKNRDYDKLLVLGLKTLNKTEADIDADKKSASWKIALGSWLKERTAMKNKVISNDLHMGHPATMSNHITSYRRNQMADCNYSRILSEIL